MMLLLQLLDDTEAEPPSNCYDGTRKSKTEIVVMAVAAIIPTAHLLLIHLDLMQATVTTTTLMDIVDDLF